MTPDAGRIVVEHLTKDFGGVRAVDDLSFVVEPGSVTGFLGPNGAGKTTTLRILLGLVAPTSGTATIGGRRYADLDDPLHAVGASLEATGFHPGRTARDHLRWVASSCGIPVSRADEVLALVGLSDAARRRAGGFSLGMRQRLALAAALLGDPRVLVLDEPANGLDPQGIAWLRGFLRHLAGEGRTVIVSSHVLSEVQQSVDDVVVIARGRLATAGPLATLGGPRGTRARSPRPEELEAALVADGLAPRREDDGSLTVEGVEPERIGAVAFRAGVELHHLARADRDLEQQFLALVARVEQEAEASRRLPPPPPVDAGAAA